MKAYIAYKEWWTNVHRHNEDEETFEQHVEDLGLYKLMEILVDWEG
jgi:hypothetical protein